MSLTFADVIGANGPKTVTPVHFPKDKNGYSPTDGHGSTPDVHDFVISAKTIMDLITHQTIPTIAKLEEFYGILSMYTEYKQCKYAAIMQQRMSDAAYALNHPPEHLTGAGVRITIQYGKYKVTDADMTKILQFIHNKIHHESGEPTLKDITRQTVERYVEYVNDNIDILTPNIIDEMRPQCMKTNQVVGQFEKAQYVFNETEILNDERFDVETRKVLVDEAHAYIQKHTEYGDVPYGKGPCEVARFFGDHVYALCFRLKGVIDLFIAQKPNTQITFSVTDKTFSNTPKIGSIARTIFHGFLAKCVIPLADMPMKVVTDEVTTPPVYKYTIGHEPMKYTPPVSKPYISTGGYYGSRGYHAPSPPAYAPPVYGGAAGGGAAAGGGSRNRRNSSDEMDFLFGANDRDNYNYLA